MFWVEMNLLIERYQCVMMHGVMPGGYAEIQRRFLAGRGSRLRMLQWALVEKRGEKAPKRSRSANDGYECNLLLICRGRDEVVFRSWEA